MTNVDRLSGVNGGVAIKAPVQAATTAEITLSGEQTIDGVACVEGNRVLVKDQGTASQNGVYDVSTGNWTRSTDFNGNRDIVQGTLVFVAGGSLNGGDLFEVTTANPITIDSTSIAFDELTLTAALDATLTAIAALTGAADKIAYFSGVDTAALADFTAFGRTLVAVANAAAARTALGLVPGTDVQTQDAELAALAGLTSSADKVPYFTGSGTAALADLSTFTRTLTGSADAAAFFTALGISAFIQTVLNDADAATARTTLGLVIGTNVQAYDAELAAIAGLTSAADKLAYFTGSGSADVTDFTSFARQLLDDADAATMRATLGVSLGAGDLVAANDLSDVASEDQSRANLVIQGRNIIDNGDCGVSQRNAASGTVTADNAYFADRWRYLGEASGTCFGRVSGIGSTIFAGGVLFTGTTDKGGAFQVVEGINSKHLRSTAVVLSAVLQVNNARLGNMKMGIIEFTGTEDATTGDPISSWGASGTTPTLAASWAFVNTPANLSVTTSAVRYSVTGTVSAGANNLAVLIWNDDKVYNASDLFYFSEVQLEYGAVASPYERIPHAVQFDRCQRYFEKSYDHLTVPGATTTNGSQSTRAPYASATNTPQFALTYRTRKRIVPATIVLYSTTGASGNFRNVTSGADGAVTAQHSGETAMSVFFSGTCSIGDLLGGHFTASADL